MRTITIDDPGRQSVSLSVTRLRCVNMAERIEVLLGVPRNIVLDKSLDFPTDSMMLSLNYFGNLSDMQTGHVYAITVGKLALGLGQCAQKRVIVIWCIL